MMEKSLWIQECEFLVKFASGGIAGEEAHSPSLLVLTIEALVRGIDSPV